MVKKNWLSNLLDKLEDIEIKMIYGVFLFVFIKVPTFIKDTLIEWFSILMKLIKVMFLFILWLSIIFSPIIYFVYVNYDSEYVNEVFHNIYINYDSEYIKDIFNEFSNNQYFIIVSFCVSVGLIGSIWGVFHVRRKQYSWVKSMKEFLFSRKITKKNNE